MYVNKHMTVLWVLVCHTKQCRKVDQKTITMKLCTSWLQTAVIILLLLSFIEDCKLTEFINVNINTIVGLSSCEAGDVYDRYNRVNNIEGWWYLNVQLPTTCSGRVTEYKFEYYNPQNGNEETYSAIVAMWAPVNGAVNLYEQVCCSAFTLYSSFYVGCWE